MQTFSGFHTKQQESLYNTYLEKLLQLFQTKILKIDSNKQYNQDKFVIQFTNIYENLLKLEQSKFRAPKFSECINELANNYGIKTIQELPQIEEQVNTPEVKKKRGKNFTPGQPIAGQNIYQNNQKVQKYKEEPKYSYLNMEIDQKGHFQSVSTRYSECADIEQEPQLCSNFKTPTKVSFQRSQERIYQSERLSPNQEIIPTKRINIRKDPYNTIEYMEKNQQNSDSEKSQQQIEQQMKLDIKIQQLNRVYKKNNRIYHSFDIQKSQSSNSEIHRTIKEIKEEKIVVNIKK